MILCDLRWEFTWRQTLQSYSVRVRVPVRVRAPVRVRVPVRVPVRVRAPVRVCVPVRVRVVHVRVRFGEERADRHLARQEPAREESLFFSFSRERSEPSETVHARVPA